MSATVNILCWAQPLLPGDGADMAALAAALAGEGARVHLAWGGFRPPVLPGVAVAALPPAGLADPAGRLVAGADGRPVDNAWKKRRAAATLKLLADTGPALVVLDCYPFARRAFRFELRPLLGICAARRPAVPVVCRRPPGPEEPDAPERLAGLAAEALPLLAAHSGETDRAAAARALLRLAGAA